MDGMDSVDAVVIGAGVIGLATARALALAGHEVLVIEREGVYGSGVSARNSEVVHAGLYYPSGSLKAQLCVRGRALLLAYCEARGVAHRRCGKLVVATSAAEEPALHVLLQGGLANGVDGLQAIGAHAARRLEPALACVDALLSPGSAIVDSHGLMTALLADAEGAGALLALNTPFVGAEPGPGGWQVRTGGSERFALHCRWLVNAAGLGAQAAARGMAGFPAVAVPAPHWAKGHYFGLSGRSPFSRLIYPMPVDGGLGIHLTLDLVGQARFGPDVEWLAAGGDEASLDFRVDIRRADGFAADIRRYWPALPDGALAPAYTGVRPKLAGPGAPAADFVIAGPAEHGMAGVVQLFGIESPGLTACLAIAEEVVRRILDSGP
jgi:L-2-hydroxyglutarate oxidase LhgO